MNITFISLWAHKLFRQEDPQPFGGAEIQLKLLATSLASHKEHCVNFITRGMGAYEEYEHEGINIIKLPYYESKRQRMFQGARDIINACKASNTDVFVQRAGGIETGLVAYAAKKTGKPFVFMTSHKWDVDGTRKKKLGFPLSWVYTYGLKRANAIITQTTEQQELLEYHLRRPSTVLRSAHTIPETIPEDKQGILWIARCEPWKQPEVFLELVRESPMDQFTMVCPKANSDEYFNKIKNEAEELKNLNFIPGVSFEETEKLFASHRLFVSTSKHEGYPNTFVQAFKWGTPIISYELDPDEILNNYGTGICSRGDFSKFSATVGFYARNKEQWQSIQNNQRAFAFEHHDINKIIETFLTILRGAQ